MMKKMNQKNTFNKNLAFAIILLFIGVAFAPSINASVVKDDLVEFDVEFCGLGKKHTVQLTQKEAEGRKDIEILLARSRTLISRSSFSSKISRIALSILPKP